MDDVTVPAREGLAPTASEVLVAVTEEIETGSYTLDRLEIKRATDLQYAYRLYVVGESDYDGGVLTFG